jgi:hypothetical protein
MPTEGKSRGCREMEWNKSSRLDTCDSDEERYKKPLLAVTAA